MIHCPRCEVDFYGAQCVCGYKAPPARMPEARQAHVPATETGKRKAAEALSIMKGGFFREPSIDWAHERLRKKSAGEPIAFYAEELAKAAIERRSRIDELSSGDEDGELLA